MKMIMISSQISLKRRKMKRLMMKKRNNNSYNNNNNSYNNYNNSVNGSMKRRVRVVKRVVRVRLISHSRVKRRMTAVVQSLQRNVRIGVMTTSNGREWCGVSLECVVGGCCCVRFDCLRCQRSQCSFFARCGAWRFFCDVNIRSFIACSIASVHAG